MEIINGKKNGDVYQLSFWLSLISFFVIPVLLLIPFSVLIITKDQSLSIEEVLLALTYNSGNQEVAMNFLIKSTIIEFIGKIILLVILIGILRKIFVADLKRYRFNYLLNTLLIIGGAILIYFVGVAQVKIYELLGIEGESSNQALIETLINSEMRPLMFIMVVFFAPVLEELIFRKLLIGYLTQKLRWSLPVASLISVFSFALIHVIADPSSYIFIFQYLTLSAIITLSYVFSKNNIYVPIGVHLINNLLAYLLV